MRIYGDFIYTGEEDQNIGPYFTLNWAGYVTNLKFSTNGILSRHYPLDDSGSTAVDIAGGANGTWTDAEGTETFGRIALWIEEPTWVVKG